MQVDKPRRKLQERAITARNVASRNCREPGIVSSFWATLAHGHFGGVSQAGRSSRGDKWLLAAGKDVT
jgi:hypothetical protein